MKISWEFILGILVGLVIWGFWLGPIIEEVLGIPNLTIISIVGFLLLQPGIYFLWKGRTKRDGT